MIPKTKKATMTDRFKQVYGLARRSVLWDEFQQAATYMDIPYIQAIKEAVYMWVKAHDKEVKNVFARHSIRWQYVKPDLVTLWTCVCIECHKAKKTAIDFAMRDWIDAYRRGETE